ncbi:MAG: penicillin-binding protein activator [Rickettsiales bacterium]|nr:penicillin-binding protein activator [Rickettsiales bacterium]
MTTYSKLFSMAMVHLLLVLSIVSCRRNMDYFLKRQNIVESDIDFRDADLKKQYERNLNNLLRVALFVPLSGPVKSVGEDMANAAQLSLFENRKKDIILRVYDTKGTTFGVVEAMNRAIEEGVDVIIGPVFRAETKAVQKIAERNDILVFSLSSEQDLVNSRNIFVTGPIVEQEIQLLISYMVEKDVHNYVGLMPNTSFGASVNRILREAILGKDAVLIKTEYYDQNDQHMLKKIIELVSFYEIPKTIYENFEKKKLESRILGDEKNLELEIEEEDKIYPQAMFIAEGGRFADQIGSLVFSVRKERRNVQLIGTSKLDGNENTLKNPYLDETIFIGANPEKYEKYSVSYDKVYGHRPLKITSIVYDLINVIDRVYRREDGIYRPDKYALLDPKGFSGIDGRFRFLPNGLVERKLYVLQFKNGEKIVLSTNQEFLNY